MPLLRQPLGSPCWGANRTGTKAGEEEGEGETLPGAEGAGREPGSVYVDYIFISC